jgi:hypothetical protein
MRLKGTRRMNATATLAIRTNPANADHHLFDNHGTWWCHYTLHLPDYTKRRVRVSLETRHPDTARRRRDALLGQLRAGGVL